VLYTKVKNYDIIIVYYEKNNKGDYNMSKVKQWAEDTAEKSVDLILKKLKDGQIDLDTATTDILSVENVSMTGINADNVGEVISENA
jgi:hypothetical protein